MTKSDWGKCLGAVVLGAGAGALLEGERGAYVGAAAGVAACFAINAHSKRTRTAGEVESDYRAVHQQLPAQPEVISYATNVPSTGIRRGEPLKIVSNIEAISGSQQPITQVREQVRLYEPGNQEPFKTTEKVASESTGSGAYENTFTITFPQNFPQGRYTIETALFINGKKVDQGNTPIQVVFDGVDLIPVHATLARR
ncbi:TIGR02186 family protein [Stenotrophomonas sp.]|uniref:TIGR02186 family protein n=1 Tax=Stenotrophomonas sp. TaxID=69392 RepID=UPI0028B01AAF|nr:TIGR02186 family protein [Stenotrophomonas sp.]